MAELRTDSFTEYSRRDQQRKSSFYGRHVHTGTTMKPSELAPEVARATYDEFPYVPSVIPTSPTIVKKEATS